MNPNAVFRTMRIVLVVFSAGLNANSYSASSRPRLSACSSTWTAMAGLPSAHACTSRISAPTRSAAHIRPARASLAWSSQNPSPPLDRSAELAASQNAAARRYAVDSSAQPRTGFVRTFDGV